MMRSAYWLGPAAFCLSLSLLCGAVAAVGVRRAAAADEPFRPEQGKFPPLAKAVSYRGELAFVDHANRRGSIRVQGPGMFFRNSPQPFALLPYGMVRYRGAPADLRDVPLGTILHVRAYLPPDPKTSAVPVIGKGNDERPAENHVILLEDEPSRCLREGQVWKLKELEIQNLEGSILASLESKAGGGGSLSEEKLTFNSATRIWRGRECLTVEEMVADGAWPSQGKKPLAGQSVLLGIVWRPTPGGVFNRFHIADIWLDELAAKRAAQQQTEVHRAFIRGRWMPAWVDNVEYGKFGRATITATLFGGMDPALYADFAKGGSGMMGAAENTLKHAAGAYGPAHMAVRGPIVDVIKLSGDIPAGSSGIQVKLETDLVIEGLRPGRVVRVRPSSWPQVDLPREEYLNEGSVNLEERFPSPAIFPKY